MYVLVHHCPYSKENINLYNYVVCQAKYKLKEA